MQPLHYSSCSPSGRATAQAMFHYLTAWRRRAAAVLALLCAQLLLAGAAQAQATVVADPGFNPGTGPTNGLWGLVYATAVQPDGKVLIGGDFTDVSSTPRSGIARLNTDGSLDATFDPGSGADGGTVSGIAVQSDGKVLIKGQFTTVNNVPRNSIARLDANGSLDDSFDPGAGIDGPVNAIVLQSDGKVLIGGGFTDVNGTARNGIARLNDDGTLDTSFNNPGIGANSSVYSIAVQPIDGKVLIGGFFTDINGTARNGIARLNDDGTLDTNFDLGSGTDDPVYSIAVQPDGKVLIGGLFYLVNNEPRSQIARLDADGTLDTSFDMGALSGKVLSIVVQPDGRLLIGGGFNDVYGSSRPGIVRLMPDGSLDTSFDPGTGVNNGDVRSITLQPDGKVVIGGNFTDFDGVARIRIARLALPLTATASVSGGNGSISPSTYNATEGTVIRFTLTPDAGYVLDTAASTSTCGGSWSGNVFTTDPLSANCTVNASLRLPAPVPVPTPVPTLGPWALLGLLGVIGLWGGRRLRRV